jgi:hypothetical protein
VISFDVSFLTSRTIWRIGTHLLPFGHAALSRTAVKKYVGLYITINKDTALAMPIIRRRVLTVKKKNCIILFCWSRCI